MNKPNRPDLRRNAIRLPAEIADTPVSSVLSGSATDSSARHHAGSLFRDKLLMR